MSDKKIIEFISGSITDNALGIVADPASGALYQTGYKAMKDYFTSGINGSGSNFNTGSLATTSSLNSFTASYLQDSSSFNLRINSVTGSGGIFNTGSLATTASLNFFTASYGVDSASFNTRILSNSSSIFNISTSYHSDSGSFLNLISSISGSGGGVSTIVFQSYTSSVNTFSASVFVDSSSIDTRIKSTSGSIYTLSGSNLIDSASFNTRINNIPGLITGSLVNTSSFGGYTSSANVQILNIFASESNYTPTSSFNSLSSSYSSDSSSFLNKINNVYSSESNYLLNISYFIDSSSFLSKIGNVFSSESNYILTSSFNSNSASTGIQINNVFFSESNYLPTSSYLIDSSSVLNKISNVYSSESNYTPTSSFNNLSGSYVIDSSSFSGKISNIFSSESNYTPTSSFNSFSSSYVVDSSSLNVKINNTFASESNYVLTSSFNSYSSSIFGNTFYGTIYNSSSWSNLNDFISTATVIVSGSKLQVSGGVGTYTQNLQVVGPTMLEKWRMTARIQINSTGSTDYGIGLGVKSMNTYGASSVVARVNFNTGSSSPIRLENSSGGGGFVNIGTSNSNISVSLNDYVIINIERNYNTIYASARNDTQNSIAVSSSYSYGYDATYIPNTGLFTIYSLGGTFIVDSLNIVSDEIKNANLMIIGDSKAVGFFANTFYTRWATLVAQKYWPTVVHAGGFDRAVEVSSSIQEIINLNPKNVLMAIGSNDPRSGQTTASFQNNYTFITNTLLSHSINVYHTIPFFETAQDLSSQVAFITSSFPSNRIIDTKTPTLYSGSLYTDGIHLTNIGAKRVYEAIVESYKLQIPSNNNFDLINTGVGTISGSGVTGYVTVFDGVNSISSSTIYQTAGNLGIGTTTPQSLLNIGVGNNNKQLLVNSIAPNANSVVEIYAAGGVSIPLRLVSDANGRIAVFHGSANASTNTGYGLQFGVVNGTSLINNISSFSNVNSGTPSTFQFNASAIGFGTVTVPTAIVHIQASTATTSSLRINSGSAPTTPNDGDIWYEGVSGTLKMRISGSTKTFTMT